jgi:pimeloyl-ACP methyl ester carboxylesterase
METRETSKRSTVRDVEVVVDGVRAPAIEAGPREEREAVVFIHGNPGSSGEWRRLVQQSGSFARAVAFDLPGFGQADKPRDFDYSVAGYARFIDGALAQLGIERAHLVLHDFGGAFGFAWAVEHPDRLASIGLLNIGILPGYRWHYFAKIWRTPLLGEIFQVTTTRAVFRTSIKHGNPRGLPDAFLDEVWRNYDRRTRQVVLDLYRSVPASAIHELAAQMIEAFHDRDVPAMVLWGQHDPYLSWRYAERQREAFPSAQVHLLPDSGHWPHVDNPDTVAGLLLPFLQRQAVRTRSARVA